MNNFFLYPSTFLAANKPTLITTVLGSCVAVCLWDRVKKIGGMNHYLLPLWNGVGLASPKYGNIAIEKMINKLIDYGSTKNNIQAKVFGGANLFKQKKTQFKIGERNIEIALSFLKDYKIRIINQNTGGNYGRKIIFNTESGIVYHKFLINNE